MSKLVLILKIPLLFDNEKVKRVPNPVQGFMVRMLRTSKGTIVRSPKEQSEI